MRSMSLAQRLLLRLTCTLYLPRLALKHFRVKQDLNPLNDGKKKLTGRKLTGTSSDIKFKDVKECAKKLKVTINDLLTACLASTLKQYFEFKGDKKTNKINLAIPGNIRFGPYLSWEKVKFENKFAPIPLIIPLDSDIRESLRKVPKVTSQLRHQFVDTYAAYALSYYMCMFMPYSILNYMSQGSLPYTLVFSNVPGLIKPIENHGKKSIKMQSYFVPLGPTGLAFSCISYVEYLKICCTVDEAVMKEP